MAKVLKNTTIAAISIQDAGVTIPASPGQYTIPEQDYLIWQASVNVISYINSGALVVNDGVNNLSAARGLAYIKEENATHLNGIFLDQTAIADGRVPTYNAATGTLRYVTPTGQMTGGLLIANFSSTANSNANVFLNTFGVSASSTLSAIAPVTGVINRVTISLNGVGTAVFEFRVNTSVGAAAASVTITAATSGTFTVNLPVNLGDKINCKVASGATGIAKPLVNIYM